ncbi:MAG: CDP-glucose 4,6-dehydratase [Candidatus Eremiobacter antarcticus]
MGFRKGALEGLEVTQNFWRGKRVFITGHTGFKGSWLCAWLLRLGADVSGYALPPATFPSLFEALKLRGAMKSVEADIADLATLAAAVRSARPDIVFHLAAQALVYEGYRHPLDTYRTNALGTAHLLEVIRACPEARAAVIVTSDKCYDLGANRERYAEEDALGGRDPYSSSKACAEVITAAYGASFFLQRTNGHAQAVIASARAGNVLGGGDWSPHRLVPDAIAAFQKGLALCVRSPKSIRPWQYVLDPLRGYLLLAQHLAEGGAEYAKAWNFGPPESHEISVETLVDMLVETWGKTARWEFIPALLGFHESAALRLDSKRAGKLLDWAPRLDVGEAIKQTAGWYREYAAGGKAGALVDRSLYDYECAGVT